MSTSLSESPLDGAVVQRDTAARRRRLRRETMFALALVAPALVPVFGIFLYPALSTLVLSFADYDMARLSIRRFVGWGNYAFLFNNPDFVAVVLRTAYFGLLVALATTVMAFLIALLLDQQFFGRGVVRVAVVLPLLRPGMLAAFIFAFILSWVEFLTPLIFTSDLRIVTVALGMFRSTFDIQVGQQAAAAVLTLLPVALMMLLFQRLITRVMLGGAER